MRRRPSLSTEVEAKVLDILTVVLKPTGKITIDSSSENQESWDSLKHMMVILGIEEAFGIAFSEGEIAKLASAKALIAAVSSRVRR